MFCTLSSLSFPSSLEGPSDLHYRRLRKCLPVTERVKLQVHGLVLKCGRVDVPEAIMEMAADEVLSLAKSMWNDAKNQAGVEKATPISVEVEVRTLRQPNESEQEGIARACTEFAKTVLNSKSSECLSRVKALEYVRLGSGICLRPKDAGLLQEDLCGYGGQSLAVCHANCIVGQLAREDNFCIR